MKKIKQFIQDLKEFGTALLIAVVILLLWAETWWHRAWLEVKKGE